MRLSAEDIFEELEIDPELKLKNKTQDLSKLSEEEKEIFNIIKNSSEAIHIDKIIQSSKLDTSDAAQILSMLMLYDLIKESEPNHYIAI